MKNKRAIWAIATLSLIAMINITDAKSQDATQVQAVNSDLIWLSISSLKQINEQVQESTHKRNCDK